MMTGTGRVSVGESAASKKYRMTLAADKRLVSPPPVESNPSRTFVVNLPEPPKPPRPAMARPLPPPKLRSWEDRGWVARLRHHMHLYNHERAERKDKLALEQGEAFSKKLDLYHNDEQRFRREDREYREKLESYRRMLVRTPESKAIDEEMSDYDKAVVGLRKQVQQLGKHREQQFNYVLETQAACQDNYNKAKSLLLLPGSEALAALKAKDYLNATRELDRAKNKYIALCDDESRIVNTLETALDSQFNKAVNENLSVVSEKIAEDISEIRDLRQELDRLAVPESVMRDAEEANKDLGKVLAEMQEKIKNETRRDLGIEGPYHNGTQQYAEPAALLV